MQKVLRGCALKACNRKDWDYAYLGFSRSLLKLNLDHIV